MSIDKAGNQFRKARFINLNSEPKAFRDFVGTNDQYDFYKFRVSARSSFQATLTNLRANADMRLYDQQGRQVALSAKGGQKPELIREQLASGSYYIRVSRKSGNTSYKLTAATIKDLPGETLVTSLNLGTLGDSSVSIQDSIGWKDTQDWYQFKVENDDTTSFVFLSFTLKKNNVSEVSLFSEGGNLIETLDLSNTSFQDSIVIGSGTYYIYLKSQNVNVMGSYSLSLVFSTGTFPVPTVVGSDLPNPIPPPDPFSPPNPIPPPDPFSPPNPNPIPPPDPFSPPDPIPPLPPLP